MRVREVMTRRVETVSATDSAADAREKMRAKRIRHLAVMDGRELSGVVSSRDLEPLILSPGGPLVGDVMTSPAVSVGPDETLRQAANRLRGRTIGCLPVLEKGKLVGILTTTDLLEVIGRGVERPVARTRRWVLKDRGPRRRKAVG